MHASSQMYKRKTMKTKFRNHKGIKADMYQSVSVCQTYTLRKNAKIFSPEGRAKK